MRDTTEYYTMTGARVDEIRAAAPDLTEEWIREYCLADWPLGEEHQQWLDTAPPEEIADWIKAGA